MPRSPILDREVLVEQLADGSIRPLDMALVNTTMGGGVEPQPVTRAGTHPTSEPDGFDNKFEATATRITVIGKDNSGVDVLTLTNGLQTPRTW